MVGSRDEKIDTQIRMDPSVSPLVIGGGAALSAWVAEQRNRLSGQELTEGDGRTFSDLAHKAKVRELEARGRSQVFSSGNLGAQSSDLGAHLGGG